MVTGTRRKRRDCQVDDPRALQLASSDRYTEKLEIEWGSAGALTGNVRSEISLNEILLSFLK